MSVGREVDLKTLYIYRADGVAYNWKLFRLFRGIIYLIRYDNEKRRDAMNSLNFQAFVFICNYLLFLIQLTSLLDGFIAEVTVMDVNLWEILVSIEAHFGFTNLWEHWTLYLDDFIHELGSL